MDKFQATFEILYLLSTVDGHLADAELEVIKSFILQNNGSINFNIKQTVDAVDSLTVDGKWNELIHAAGVINQVCDAREKNIILDFALRLIAADGKLDPNEQNIFFGLAKAWNIDAKRFIEART